MSADRNAESGGRRCPRCGAELPDGVAEDRCPKCLIGMAMDTMTDAGTTTGITTAPPGGRCGALPRPGETFGHYRIVRQLGAGGMGAAYEAEDLENGRRVALKVLSHRLDSPDTRARFLREGRLAASINHPNSVYIFGTDEIDGMPVIAMELIAGGTLQERVARQGPLPVGAAVDAVLQIIAGLEAAQAIGILHRDIKPANCFEDADGTVKIGDFGLSISTAARGETNLTLEGTFLGTPAFCSPEQLRGEELNVRSDMYSVGVTLFYLLTGRTPFAAENMVQLLATVLEKPAPSPRQFQPETPRALADAVLRCLQKTVADRFRTYDELRQALAPFSSTAPVPAALGRRFLAGMLDTLTWGAVSGAVSVAVMVGSKGRYGPPTDAAGYQSLGNVLFIALSFLLYILYYAAPEGRCGASLGKWVCGVRVVGPDRNPPGVPRACVRAAVYLCAPALPMWLAMAIAPETLMGGPHAFGMLGLAYSTYLVMALLFCTARRRNGYAAVHDLLSKTRVIRRPAHQARPAPAAEAEPARAAEAESKVGPYHVLEALEKTEGGEWLLGYDTRLLRKVWLRVVPAGTPPVAPPWRTLGRVGRLRWITGRRTPQENWDAFEGITGQPLVGMRQPRPWAEVRYWLLDLAVEIAAAEKDGTLPGTLTVDRVWITGDGRAKLLDFRAPGAAASPAPAGRDPGLFLLQVACAALAGGADAEADPKHLRVPLPVHARKLLASLPGLPGAGAIARAIQLLLANAAVVTRGRRAALVLGCAAVPLLMAVFGVLGTTLYRSWSMRQPDVMEMSRLLNLWSTSQMKLPWLKDTPWPVDEEVAVYLASRYRSTITNEVVWKSASARVLITGRSRTFAEASVAKYPNPTAEQVAKATAALQPHLKNVEAVTAVQGRQPAVWAPLLGALVWMALIGATAVFAALVARGGLVMFLCGVAVVRKDGLRASRWRIFWRSLVAWSPVAVSPVLIGLTVRTAPRVAEAAEAGAILAPMAAGAVLAALFALACAAGSLTLPGRGLHDRLAGTTLVPR